MNSNGHKSILIVDDEEGVRTLLKHIFETQKPHYQVVTASRRFHRDGLTDTARV